MTDAELIDFDQLIESGQARLLRLAGQLTSTDVGYQLGVASTTLLQYEKGRYSVPERAKIRDRYYELLVSLRETYGTIEVSQPTEQFAPIFVSGVRAERMKRRYRPARMA